MPAVCSNNATVLRLRMFFDDITKFPNENARLHRLDSLFKTFAGCLNNSNIVWISFGFIANIVRLVQIGMVTLVVERNIDVQDIAIDERSLIGNTVANNFVDRCTA